MKLYLYRRICLAGIHKLPAVSTWEITDKIRPYVAPLHLRLTNDSILLPEKITVTQYIEHRKGCGEKYNKGIPYQHIIHITEHQPGETAFYLRTGYVFIFSQHRWKVINIHTGGIPANKWIKNKLSKILELLYNKYKRRRN